MAELQDSMRSAEARRYVFQTVAAGASSFALSGCGGVLDPQGPVGAAEKIILLNSVAIMLVIIVPVIVGTLAVAWWFRASNRRAERRPDWVYSGRIELLVWSIPALVISFLGGIAWIGSHELDPAKPLASQSKAIEVQVVSLDWKWLFIYPEQGIATVNAIVVPVGVPVHFRLTSATVMNSFFVPRLGSQIYTMAGMATQLYLQADRPGIFPGLSTHLSGDGFAGMRFDVRSVPSADFANWTNNMRRQGPVLDTAGYVSLARPSSKVRPHAYRAVQPGLFDAIVMQTIPGTRQKNHAPNGVAQTHSRPSHGPEA